MKPNTSLAYSVALLSAILVASTAFGQEMLPSVNLVVQNQEISAFSSRSDRWVSVNLALSERVRQQATSPTAAIVVTNERLLGFSVFTNDWHEHEFGLADRLRRMQLDGSIATVVMNSGTFAFNAETGKWIREPD